MYSTFITLALLFVAPAFASYAINEPKLVQCETAKVSWPKTKGPYNVIAVAADAPCGEPLVDLGDITGTFVEWQVNLAAGTVVQLSVADAEDTEAWTKNITIGGGDNKSCMGGDAASDSAASDDSADDASRTSAESTTDSTTESKSEEDDLSPAAVGAANAGSNQFFGDDSAAPSSRHLSQAAATLGALAAVAAYVL